MEGREPAFVDSLLTTWQEESGFLDPETVVPGEHVPGWGLGANWIEMEARTTGKGPWGFCLDDLVLRFHKEEFR